MTDPKVLQQRLWRWHFWAGLMSLPLALILAITGGLYLFKPQYVQWHEQQLEQHLITAVNQPLATDQLQTIAIEQVPGGKFKSYTLARENDRSVEFEFRSGSTSTIVWVDRFTGEILQSSPKHKQLMHWIKNLHGELTLGNGGSYVVELMAQWMIVLIITGLTLYLSRQKLSAQGHWGIALWRSLFPSLKPGTKIFWKRLHAVLGVWLSLFLLLLLISGLPWTQVWGNGFKQLQQAMGWDGPGQEWRVSLTSKSQKVSARPLQDGSNLWRLSSQEQDSVTLQSGDAPGDAQGITLGQIEAKILPLDLLHPVVISPPNDANGVWSVRSMTPNRPQRVTIHFDRWSGEEIMRIDFGDYHPVKRLVSYGIALHEGALFGLANQLLGLVTALGLVAIVVSGGIMWWKRRPQSQWGVPKLLPGALPKRVWFFTALLGALLPLFAASALLVVLLDFLWLRIVKGQAVIVSGVE